MLKKIIPLYIVLIGSYTSIQANHIAKKSNKMCISTKRSKKTGYWPPTHLVTPDDDNNNNSIEQSHETKMKKIFLNETIKKVGKLKISF